MHTTPVEDLYQCRRTRVRFPAPPPSAMDGSYLRGNYLVLHKASADVETPITPMIVAPRLML